MVQFLHDTRMKIIAFLQRKKEKTAIILCFFNKHIANVCSENNVNKTQDLSCLSQMGPSTQGQYGIKLQLSVRTTGYQIGCFILA